MAITTGFCSIRIRGIFHNALVSCLPIRVIGVTAMTFMARYHSMVLIVQDVTVNKNFLVRGQRLHNTFSSPLTFYFWGLSHRSGFSDLPGYLYQFLCAGMAFKALGILICLS
jgi:hypothetical protein